MTKKAPEAKIIIVEDDENLGFLLVDFLENNGFDVKLFRDGISGLAGFKSGSFDFCILDLMLPKMDGFTLAEKIKEMRMDIPVIILSARSMKDDKIKGFRLGIDDYITKPFDEEELLYRIRAIINRTKKGNIADAPALYKIGKFEFDPGNQLLSVDQNSKRLTLKESLILKMLAGAAGNMVKREEIMIEVWGDSDYYTGRSLDVFVSKLRGYLREDPQISITTIPTVGYILDVNPKN